MCAAQIKKVLCRGCTAMQPTHLLACLLILALITSPAWAEPGDPEAQIDQSRQEERAVLSELFNYELELVVINQQMETTLSKIGDLEVSLGQAKDDLAASERKMTDRQDLIRKRLRFLYEDGRVSYLEVLLSATSFSDLISRFDLVQTVISHDIQILQETKTIRAEITRKAQTLVNQQQQLVHEQTQLGLKKEEVTTVIAQRENYLHSLRENRAYYEGMMEKVMDRWNEQIMPEITRLAFNIGYVVSDPDIIKDAETQVSIFPPGITVGISDSALNKRLWAKEQSLTPFQVAFEEGQVVIRRDLDYELRVYGRFELDDKKQIVFTVTDMSLDGLAISDNLRQTMFRGMKVSFNPTALPMKLQVSDFIAKPGKLMVRMR